MPHFSLYQLVIFLGIANGIILLVTMAALPKRFKRPTRFLSLFILGYSIYIANWTIIPSITFYFDIPPLWIPSLYFLPALAYFFTQSITYSPESFSKSDKLLLVPGIVDLIYQLVKWINVLVKDGRYYFPLDDRREFFIYEGIGILFSAFCFLKIYLLISDSQLRKGPIYRFYKVAFYFLIFVLVRWICLYAIDFFKPSLLSFELQFSFWLIDLFCFLFLGYRNLVAPNKYSTKLPKEPISGAETDQLLSNLKKEKLYTNPEFSRRDLAEHLGITEERVSAILNEELGITFYKLVNELRVEEARLLLDQGMAEKLTMEAVANRAGFKSKTTFYKFFKEHLGVKPGEYVQGVE